MQTLPKYANWETLFSACQSLLSYLIVGSLTMSETLLTTRAFDQPGSWPVMFLSYHAE